MSTMISKADLLRLKIERKHVLMSEIYRRLDGRTHEELNELQIRCLNLTCRRIEGEISEIIDELREMGEKLR
jgi:hypothetical protein